MQGTQTAKILRAIKKSGKRGVENYKLADISLNYTRRISELRAEGHNIYCERYHVRGKWTGTWKYYLNSDEDLLVQPKITHLSLAKKLKQTKIEELLLAKSRGRGGIYKHVCGRLEQLLIDE